MTPNHPALIATVAFASTCVGLHALAQTPAKLAPKPAAAQPAKTAAKPTATPTLTASPAPTAKASNSNPRGLPTNMHSVDRVQAIIEYTKKKRTELKNYACPPNVNVEAGTGMGPATLAFTRAAVSPSLCSTSADLAPSSERGGPCLSCYYQGGVELRRSAPQRHSCWVKPDATNSFACEYVPPLPVSQTCQFEIDPGNMDLYPFGDHTRGDTDLYTEGSLLDPGSLAEIDVTVKLVRSGSKLVWKLDGEVKESNPDHTTFGDYKSIDLKSSDVKNGTLADIETCLASYGTQRPFPERTGSAGTVSDGNDWHDYSTVFSQGTLRFSMSCRVDTNGSDSGQVGCKNINVERFSLNLK
jgi:hypothetical protein